MPTHKFNAVRTEYNGIKYASKKEARRAAELETLKRSGEVVFYLQQVPFHLPAGVKYVVDFQVFWANGDITFEDVKGVSTPMFVLKKKQVEALYPVTIEVI